jgi:hypothetical protein
MTALELALVIFGISAVIATLVYFFAYKKEKDRWNQGYCPECGGDWEHFDTDSQGGRMYKCTGGHYVVITYPRIDK